jgi:hypothetical protein
MVHVGSFAFLKTLARGAAFFALSAFCALARTAVLACGEQATYLGQRLSAGSDGTNLGVGVAISGSAGTLPVIRAITTDESARTWPGARSVVSLCIRNRGNLRIHSGGFSPCGYRF